MRSKVLSYAGTIVVASLILVRSIYKPLFPFVVVTSGSMEPTVYRGDLLFTLPILSEDIKINDIIVFQADSQHRHPLPIVHRLMQKRLTEDGDFEYLTKGDNNLNHDGYGQFYRHWLQRQQIKARVRGIIPYAGYPIVLLGEHMWLRYVLGTILSLLIIHDVLRKEAQ